ncbi:hypothetical protein KZ475_05375, partial [Glaesserella parasuis]|nr:hypothetical protein [Glaesserella parasuis]
MMNKIFRVIWS